MAGTKYAESARRDNEKAPRQVDASPPARTASPGQGATPPLIAILPKPSPCRSIGRRSAAGLLPDADVDRRVATAHAIVWREDRADHRTEPRRAGAGFNTNDP